MPGPGGADLVFADLVFAVPGDLGSLTGGYAYARRLLAALPGAGITATHLQLPGSFPFPSRQDLAETARLLAGTPPGAVVLVDGLAYGALPAEILAGIDRSVVALIHHPLARETGLTEGRRALLARSERAALAHADHLLVTSLATARELVSAYGVPEAGITVAVPGTDPAARTSGSAGGIPELLCVGTVTARKGYRVLVRALAGLADLDWHVSIVGDTRRSPGEFIAVQDCIDRAGLTARITFSGVLDAGSLEAAYCSSDLFVMPSFYEGYGMALAEALAHGLPVVSTTGGAATQTVPDGAGLKVPPGDAAALGAALRRILLDPALRTSCADRSRAAGAALPRWADTAEAVAGVVRGLLPADGEPAA